MILKGEKKVELRKRLPRIEQNDIVFLYVTSPVKSILGGFVAVGAKKGSPDAIWKIASDSAGITRKQYDEYFLGCRFSVAIIVGRVWSLGEAIQLKTLRKEIEGFVVPQSYRYLTEDEANLLFALGN